MNSDIFQIYKPLRNQLRKLSIENTFYVIWSYIRLMQFNKKLPSDIAAHPEFLQNHNSPSRGLYEWELALLAREVVVNSESKHTTHQTNLGQWKNLSRVVNTLKTFENNYWSVHGGEHNVIREMNRLSHRQFPWQSTPNISLILRYYKIYSHPGLADIVTRRIGLSVTAWYTIGFALMGAFLSHPKISLDPNIQLGGITKDDFDRFIEFTSITVPKLYKLIQDKIKYDDEFVYTLNPIEYYPLVEIGEYYYCPIINFLVWRITSGLFFDLIRDPYFGHPFGIAFQTYVQEVSERILENTPLNVLKEAKYSAGKQQLDSVDMIVSDNESALFVECKAKRLQARSKSQLLSEESISKDLDVLASDVVQVYITIQDYLADRYTHFPYNGSLSIFVVVVTLEDWYLFGNYYSILKKKVSQKLNKKGLPLGLINTIPFTVCSVKTLEYCLQVIQNHSIRTIFDKWHLPGNEGHDFGQHIRSEYAGEFNEISSFFPGEYEKIFDKSLGMNNPP